MSDPVITVLLATYNGERFLREQMDSILTQTYPALRVLARDDGSTDATPAILAEYAAHHPERVLLLPAGAPAGSAKENFRRLLEAAVAQDGEYLAFADQDDVWLPEKLALEMEKMRGLEARHGADRPLLAFSDLQVVDDALRPIAPSMWGIHRLRPENIRRWNRLLAQNVLTGSTALMNRALAERAVRMPADAYMHDWWVALVACAFGEADWVSQPLVRYRQHASNVLGASMTGPVTGVPKWRRHEKRREQWERGERQAEAFLREFGPELRPRQRLVLARYMTAEHGRSRWTRIFAFARGGFFTTGGLRANLAIAWYLWDMAAAKRNPEPEPMAEGPGDTGGRRHPRDSSRRSE